MSDTPDKIEVMIMPTRNPVTKEANGKPYPAVYHGAHATVLTRLAEMTQKTPGA